MPRGEHAGGIFASLKRVCRNFGRLLRARLELIAIELQEERVRLMELFALAGVAVVLGFMAIILLTAVIIFLFPDRFRIYVVAVLGILCVLGAWRAAVAMRNRLKTIPFDQTISEFKRDFAALGDGEPEGDLPDALHEERKV